MENWLDYAPYARHWLTQDDEMLLRALGMIDPVHDVCDDIVLEALDDISRDAPDDYLQDMARSLLERLEQEL